MTKTLLIVIGIACVLLAITCSPALQKEAPRQKVSIHKAFITKDEPVLLKNRPVWLKEALSKDPDVQFDAVYNLATTGYYQEAVDVLTQVTCNKYNDETTRGYAAMGLSNYLNYFPNELKDAIHQKLKKVLLDEKTDTPDEIIRMLIDYGDAFFIYETFGKDIEGYPLEVDILAALPKELASDRLWQMYMTCPKGKRATIYSRKSNIGRALVGMKDKRGLEILITLLPPDNAPGCQHRHNLFTFLASVFREKFGYESENYSAELEKATPRMLEWWKENKDFLSWSDEKTPLIIDQEAKEAGIPTGEYRRTHPWPPREIIK